MAKFVGKEAAVTFGMGYATNSATIPLLGGKVGAFYFCVVELIHTAVQCLLKRVFLLCAAHNCVGDTDYQ